MVARLVAVLTRAGLPSRGLRATESGRAFESRLGLVTRRLARSPYLAGEAFTAWAVEAAGL
jgi:glutathione S-transferase